MTVFISYRREDSSGHVGRLYDRLKPHFGKKRIFMDMVSIEPGVNWENSIFAAISQCEILLAIIGKQWLHINDKDGKQRLNDPNDFVRLEIAAALKSKTPIIPVLINDTKMPEYGELPPEIAQITRLQATELKDKTFDYDFEKLIIAIETIIGKQSKKSVLIIEDEMMTATLISHYLTLHGYSVYATHGMAEGHELARRTKFDVIVTDFYYVMHPEDKRGTALTTLRSLLPEVKIIGMTAYRDELTKMEGFDYTIAKPFHEIELLELLQKALS